MHRQSDHETRQQPSGDSFAAVGATLRREIRGSSDKALDEVLAVGTVETNSALVERRGQPIVEIACRRLGKGSLSGARLVDLGCGLGGLAALFAFRGAHVVAVDRNAARLAVAARVAEEHALDVRVVRGRMERLSLADESCEVAVMNNSLPYLVDAEVRRRALEEARRVLVPGGVLIMRNANRLHPVDQFSGLPAIHLLPPPAAVRVAAMLGRRRSLCRVRTPFGARRELLEAGFGDPVHHATGAAGRLRPKLLARYTHFSAVKPHAGAAAGAAAGTCRPDG